jgi:hypothetical protein
MTLRTSSKTVSFMRPFSLGGFDEMLPAGAYSVETDEALLEGVSFPAYRRIGTLIHLHAKPGYPGLTQILAVDPHEPDAALRRDQAPAATLAGRNAGPEAPHGTADPPPAGRRPSSHRPRRRRRDDGSSRVNDFSAAHAKARIAAARAGRCHAGRRGTTLIFIQTEG